MDFENVWRNRVAKNIEQLNNQELCTKYCTLANLEAIPFTKQLLVLLKEEAGNESTKKVLQNSACHMPKESLESVREVYRATGSLTKTHQKLLENFKKDIKVYKNISDEKVEEIVNKGMGAAGILKENKIHVTKIPSMFHEYYAETDEVMKKYYYCHCPRVRILLQNQTPLDSIYCNCGGGFYKDIWEYVTGEEVSIEVVKNLFDGDDCCSFVIEFERVKE